MLGRFRLGLIVATLVLFGLALLWTALDQSSLRPTSYAYSSLLADARAGKVTQIDQAGLELTVWLTDSEAPRTALVASDAINVYAEVCAAMGKAPGPDCPIQFVAVGESQSGQWLGLIITSLLPVLLIGSFIYFLMRQQQRKAQS